MIRTQEEFQASDHWQYHASTPLIHIEKISESEPEPSPLSSRPLSDVRALGMTHVVAGPTVLRQLAAAGAECLNFVENLRPQLAAEDLAEVRPGIIYARIKLNTVTGPWANWVGFDLSAGAFTGVY